MSTAQSKKWSHKTSIFPYELVWRAAQSALQAASVRSPKMRKHHLSIQSFLCAFLAFEGFINTKGTEVAPNIWIDERNFFNKKPYRGIIGKVNYLLSLFPPNSIDKTKAPYTEFKRLKTVRDNLAHLKSEQYSETADHGEPSFTSSIDDIQKIANAGKALKTPQSLAEAMRVQAILQLNDEYQPSHLNYPAFKGPLGTSQGFGPPV